MPMAQAVQHVRNRRIAHSDTQVGNLTRLDDPSTQGKRRDPNLLSETKQTTGTKGDRLPVTFSPKKPPSLTVSSQYSSYYSASIRVPIIRKALDCLVIIILHR